MNSFDYLHDEPPQVVSRLRALRSDRRIRGLGAFLGASLVVVLCAWALEVERLHEAQQSLQRAREQLERISVEAAKVKAEVDALHQTIALERRLFAVRESGTMAANRIASLALRLPAKSWLTSLHVDDSGGTITGRAIGLQSVGETLAAMPSRLVDVQASESGDNRVVEFQLDLPKK